VTSPPAWSRGEDAGGQRPPSIQVDGFVDVTPIGHGAFASVYRAVEMGTDRPVALKLLDVGSMQPHLIESFHAEVRALATVSSHPNIVTLYRGVAMHDGRPVLVLELCRGSYLQRVKTLGALNPGEVVAVGIKIAGALETAHRAGYLHRDVKPQNILVTQFGDPALADFGVATLAATALSTEASSGFTTLHAAPEVLEGATQSPATDVYGLASTIYQLASGNPPFQAFEGQSPASAILRILHEPPAPITRLGVPIGLSDALMRALAKDPEERPPTAAAFADLLRDVEQQAGWPRTPYLVWGDDPAAPAAEPLPFWSPPPASIDPADASPSPAPASPPPPPASPPRSPSLLIPETRSRRVLDPARVVPAPSPGPATRPSRHERSSEPPSTGPARPHVAEMPLPVMPPAPSAPPPPLISPPAPDVAPTSAATPPAPPGPPATPPASTPSAAVTSPAPPPSSALNSLPPDTPAAPPPPSAVTPPGVAPAARPTATPGATVPSPPTYGFDPAEPAGRASTGWPDLASDRAPGLGGSPPEAVTWAASVPSDPLNQTVVPSINQSVQAGDKAETTPVAAVAGKTALVLGMLAGATVIVVLVVLALAGLL
jgi:serine/threonine protein kinase